MADPATVGPRQFCWLQIAQRKRPAIVLEGREDRAIVILGTTTQRSRMRVQVTPGSRYGKALGLTRKTFFYPDNIAAIRVEEFPEEKRPCPPDLFLDIRKVIDDFNENR